MRIEQVFVEKNKEHLLGVLENAPDAKPGTFGIGRKTLKGIFEAVILERDYYFLPFCLSYIHDGSLVYDGTQEIKQNESFARSSLKWLHENGSSDLVSYNYAYALHFDDKPEACVGILYELADRDFSPALMTLGDMKLFYGEEDEAIMFYQKALELEHINARARLWSLRKKDAAAFTIMKTKFFNFFRGIKLFWDIYVLESRSQNYVHLDFHYYHTRKEVLKAPGWSI